jgi:ribosome-binding factor A
MPSSKRIERLTKVILRRAGEVVAHELKDPRLGLVTITRVQLVEDLSAARIYWSVMGDEAERSKSAHALEHARGFVQSEIAGVMHTRITPVVSFHYDESIEGAVRMSRLLDGLRKEREEREGVPEAEDGDDEE